MLGKSPFFTNLPEHLQDGLDLAFRIVRFKSGEDIRPLGRMGGGLYIVLSGFVAERTNTPQLDTLMFRQVGALVGAEHVIDSLPAERYPGGSPVSVSWCLTSTVTVQLGALQDMPMVVEHDPHVLKALFAAQVHKDIERRYHYFNFGLPAVDRVAGLLHHLTGEKNSVYGPTQSQVAEALMLSTSSVENALRDLRENEIIETGPRRYDVKDPETLCFLSGCRSHAKIHF